MNHMFKLFTKISICSIKLIFTRVSCYRNRNLTGTPSYTYSLKLASCLLSFYCYSACIYGFMQKPQYGLLPRGEAGVTSLRNIISWHFYLCFILFLNTASEILGTLNLYVGAHDAIVQKKMYPYHYKWKQKFIQMLTRDLVAPYHTYSKYWTLSSTLT